MNLAEVRSRLSDGTRLALVCKADAYGHGLVPVGRFAAQNGADVLAVATVQEGVALRDAGVVCPIMVMSPILKVECEQAVFYDLEVFVENAEIAAELSKAAISCDRECLLHLKVDTGLHRFGCQPADVVEVCRAIKGLNRVRLFGLAQHFVDSSNDQVKTIHQLEVFKQIIETCKNAGIEFQCLQAANSAGTINYPQSQYDLVRIGILAYGLDPWNLLKGGAIPTFSWFARVMSVRELGAGETLSYSSTYRLERPSRIATLGAGYGDGYPRLLSNISEVAIHGGRAKIVGMICMDQMLIDVTDLPDVRVGDTAELVGSSVPGGELAALLGTNVHEIITRIMSRVSRRYLYP